MFKSLIPLILAVSAYAQTPTSPAYTAVDSFSASSGETITIQIPAKSPKSVVGGNISGSLSAAGTICFSWNGTTATSTAFAIAPAPGGPFGIATAWKASNSTGGTAGPCFVLQSGPFNFNGLPNFYLWKNGSSPNPGGTTPWTLVQNFTATLTPATGTITGYLNLNWSEQ